MLSIGSSSTFTCKSNSGLLIKYFQAIQQLVALLAGLMLGSMISDFLFHVEAKKQLALAYSNFRNFPDLIVPLY